MAGKKKKSLANRLAKMSDEERARYMQHRADMEEEAKRRKEQLVSTFMKKKIKKEDAFTRLNVAKINQQWHQILRKAKCKEMKENVMHMKKWLEDTIAFKNRTIQKLLEELEESEEQYLHNFQSHSTHIDAIIENQNRHINKLHKTYIESQTELIAIWRAEIATIAHDCSEEEQYLGSVIFGEQQNARKSLQDQYKTYTLRNYEIDSVYKSTINQLKRNLNTIINEIWKEIAKIVRQYVEKTDKSRMHLAELKQFEKRNALEIKQNEENLIKLEATYDQLTTDLNHSRLERNVKLNKLNTQLSHLSAAFLRIKQQLQSDLKKDERQIQKLTQISNKTIESLKSVSKNGTQTLLLAKICEKFETEREQLVPHVPPLALYSTPASPPPETIIEDVKFERKEHSGPTPDFLQPTIDSLTTLDQFWLKSSRIQVDIIEIKSEKSALLSENKELRGMLRGALESVVLEKGKPERKSAPSSRFRKVLFT